MKRRLTKLYEIVNPAKVPDAGKNVDKYKSKGQPGLCLMSAKLEKKYPEQDRLLPCQIQNIHSSRSLH